MHAYAGASLTLFTREGQRKYLTPVERQRFMTVAARYPRAEVGLLCLTLAHTGCRISEALALTVASIEPDEGFVVLRSLKKRGPICHRLVPASPDFLKRLRRGCSAAGKVSERLFPFSRSRAWQLVKTVMSEAQVSPGPHMTPKGLRHAFGIHALRSGVPLNLLQRWLGHASLETTAIYAAALGDEEREIASRMWA